jgi:hypothetical protein
MFLFCCVNWRFRYGVLLGLRLGSLGDGGRCNPVVKEILPEDKGLFLFSG